MSSIDTGSFKSFYEDTKARLVGKSKTTAIATNSNTVIGREMDSIYNTSGTVVNNWYRQKPYGFIFTNRTGVSYTFYLPISPSNINIVTHFATNVVPTMYGTVEEHSEQRYYDINITGTTGMSPRYYGLIDRGSRSHGREGAEIKKRLTGALGGFFDRTLASIENTVDKAVEVFGDKTQPTSGVDIKKTGYVAFHNFYKFLLAYKRDTSGEKGDFLQRSQHPLQFINYKDNNQYDVAIQQFQLTRDSNEPFLYNYNIIMRAYNLRSANASKIVADVADRKQALGLDGLKSSLKATIANKALLAKQAAYSAIAAAKGFGS